MIKPGHAVEDVAAAYGERADEYAAVLGTRAAMADADRDTVSAWALTCDGRIIDAGCGPGHWTAYLAALGADIAGIDPAEPFISIARREHPGNTYDVGSFTDFHADTYAGVLSWYSLVHTAPEFVPMQLDAIYNALVPGGRLLLGFFAGDAVAPFPHAVTTAWTWPPGELADLVRCAGFAVERTTRRHDPGSREHGEISARKPARGTEQNHERVRDVPGGPSWKIDGATLNATITDREMFRAGVASDPLGKAIEDLWTRRTDEARSRLQVLAPNIRVKTLLADCDRLEGDAPRAVTALKTLLAEHTGHRWEPALRQHLGKALLASGDVHGARRQFRLALELRVSAAAPADQLASSRQALALTSLLPVA